MMFVGVALKCWLQARGCSVGGGGAALDMGAEPGQLYGKRQDGTVVPALCRVIVVIWLCW